MPPYAHVPLRTAKVLWSTCADAGIVTAAPIAAQHNEVRTLRKVLLPELVDLGLQRGEFGPKLLDLRGLPTCARL
jgi:hypothetical protein